MAPRTRARRAKAGAKKNQCKSCIDKHEEEGYCGASERQHTNEELTELEREIEEYMRTGAFTSDFEQRAVPEEVRGAVAALIQMKTDPNFIAPNFIAPVQKRGGTSRRGRRS